MNMTLDDIIRRVSIMEVAEHYGYTIQKGCGTRIPVMKHPSGDKICIFNPNDTHAQRYFSVRNESDKGSLYSFVKNRLDSGLIPNTTPYTLTRETGKCVMHILHAYLNIPYERRVEIQKKITDFQSNRVEKVKDMRSVMEPLSRPAFLKSRGFSELTIGCPAFKGRIGNIRGKNDIALPIYDSDDNIVGVEQRNRNIKLFVAGSHRSSGVWHSNMPESITAVFVAESPLDCMARHQMMPDNHTLYIAHGGSLCKAQIDTINEVIRKHRDRIIPERFMFLLGADNDAAGTSYDIAFIKAQLSLKSMEIENTPCDMNRKTFTIREGGFTNFKDFADIVTANIRSSETSCKTHTTGGAQQLVISYPCNDATCEREICEAILKSNALPHTRLEKAVLKDWNDDLIRIKELSRELKRFVSHEQFSAHPELANTDNHIKNKNTRRL